MRLVHKLGTKTKSEALEVWEGGICLSTISSVKKGVMIVSSFKRDEKAVMIPFDHMHKMLKLILVA